MPLVIGGKPVSVDEEGYLTDPADWNEDVAEGLAHQEHIELSDEHWAVIGFMRDYYEQRHITPDARHVIKFLAGYRGESSTGETICSGCFRMAMSSRPAGSRACADPGPGAPVECQIAGGDCMITVTPQAAEQILKSARQAGLEAAFLRLAARLDEKGTIEYGMGFDEQGR